MNQPMPAFGNKALIVLSGGQDSTTCAAWAKKYYSEVHAVSFNYNQRHSRELIAAQQVAHLLALDSHEIIDVGPVLKGTSPLTNQTEQLETYESFESMDAIIGNRIEKTFVPMRNALFLVLAANHAIVNGINIVVTGVCQADNANYPDCRQTFISAMQHATQEALGMPAGFHIMTPLMDLSKADSIRLMMKLGRLSLLAWTHTAYDGNFPPNGKDHASVLRAHGFEEADVPDPLVLRAHLEGAMELPETKNYRESSLREELESAIRFAGEALVEAGLLPKKGGK